MDKKLKPREPKFFDLVRKSASQISEKRQDIKYDTRDYVIDYMVERFKKKGILYTLKLSTKFYLDRA